MTDPKTTRVARRALHWVLAAALLLMLGLNLPGHLSYDSVAQIYEGRFNVRETFNPILYGEILGLFDRFVPGGALYVAASSALFFGALASMTALRPRTTWAAPVVAGLLALTPQILIYQGIVWKDVAFANASVAGLILLAQAGRLWSNRPARWLLLAAVLVLAAVATQVRQNGVITAVLAAAALGWIASQGSWRRGLTWGAGGLLAVMLCGSMLTRVATPANAPKELGLGAGLQILQNYDLLGAVSLDRTYRLKTFAEFDTPAEKLVWERAPLTYTGRRIDFTALDPTLSDAMSVMPATVRTAEWKALILNNPGLYLRVRWEDFRWLIAPPVIDWCLPVHVGVSVATPKMMAALQMQSRLVGSDLALSNYVSWFLDTPVFSHLTFAAASLVLAVLFLRRRDQADIPMAALQLAGLGFAASFFLITLACDYRYLYFTDLAAMTGLIYAAIDPPWIRRRPA